MPASMLGAARETSAAPAGSRPSGSSAASRAATVSGGVAAVRSRSTYSSSLEKPSGMAGLKESRGIGGGPWEKARGRRGACGGRGGGAPVPGGQCLRKRNRLGDGRARARRYVALRGARARLAPGLRFPRGSAAAFLGGHCEVGPAGDLVAAVVAA